MKKNISVIGGDLRIVKLIELLAKDNYNVFIYALEGAESLTKLNNVIAVNSIKELANNSKVVIGPIPLSSNKKDINTPFSDKIISLNNLYNNLDNNLFIAGSISNQIIEQFNNRNIQVVDLLNREELAVLNTISTAEGAIQIAIEQTYKTLHNSNVLILGFGRIGKILAKMLTGIGAKVSCEARKDADLAWIKAYGYTAIHINDLNKEINKFDIIMNTIPSMILNKERLDLIEKDCLIIDLASAPGGVDREYAKEKGIKVIWALSLPGKVAPITSAEFIQETIYNVLKEQK